MMTVQATHALSVTTPTALLTHAGWVVLAVLAIIGLIMFGVICGEEV